MMNKASAMQIRGYVVALLAFATAALVFGMFTGTSPAASSPFVAVDLGTLGGSISYAQAASDSGQVVGYSNTAGGQAHAFSWTQAGGMLDLGTLGGTSYGQAVNDSGQVVGYSDVATYQPHAFSWTHSGGMVDLGTLGGSYSQAAAVNNSGQVVGFSSLSSGPQHAFLWTQAGGMVDLGTLGGSYSRALAVNESGQVAGFSGTASGQHHAFLWTPASGMADLGVVSNLANALALNNAGQVVGLTGSEPPHAFSWTSADGMVDLGTLGGSYSFARAVSDGGEVVGGATTASGPAHPFSWTSAGGMIDLGIPGAAVAVNEHGQVVGTSGSAAFSWTSADGVVVLSTIVGGSSSSAIAVNDSGQIIGNSSIGGATHATLWRQPTDTTPPKVTAPDGLAIDATSPNGSLGEYSASAVDDVDGAVTVTCVPPSESLFPIGDTTVICTAHDSAGNTGSASFGVHVRGAAEQLARLAASVNGVGSGTSLGDKLAQAATALDAGDNDTASSILKAFSNEVRAQSGKNIALDTARALTATANQIVATIGYAQ